MRYREFDRRLDLLEQHAQAELVEVTMQLLQHFLAHFTKEEILQLDVFVNRKSSDPDIPPLDDELVLEQRGRALVELPEVQPLYERYGQLLAVVTKQKMDRVLGAADEN